jgi:tetratricopeptide (TPR) repeat protein
MSQLRFHTSAALMTLSLALAVSTNCAPRRPPAATNAAPKYPAYAKPDIPQALAVTPMTRQRYDDAWTRLQGGDTRAAARALADLLKQNADFYPAETVLGDIALIDREFKDALTYFTRVLEQNATYLPALEGRVQAALGLGDDVMSAVALERLLDVDASRDDARSRLDLVRLRIVQRQLAAAADARGAGRLDEAQQILERALEVWPSSAVLLREIARIELERGAAASAEAHVRKALEVDGSDPESLAVLGDVLEREGKTAEAADAFARAVTLDPRPAWRERRDTLRARARVEGMPAEYRAIATSATVTRAQVAAAIGIDLEPLVARASRRSTIVVTDVRTSWAAAWILPVTQAGVMDVFANHTFQPNATVRRSDLAQIASDLTALLPPGRQAEVAQWRASRPRLPDVPAGHVSYRAISLALAAGVMKLDEAGRFWPARPASGADVTAMIARLKPLAR